MDGYANFITLITIGIYILCYLLGSIPFGLILTKMAGLGDVRAIGSGNIGATNVLRTGNKKIAALTLFCDLLKGTAAVLLAYYILAPALSIETVPLAGFLAFLGHLFPVWLKFKGGKGVATYIGVILGLYWPAALVFGLVWLLVALVTRYSSLAALIAMVAVPIFCLFMPTGYNSTLTITVTLMSVISIAKHHANIVRLLKGQESKIGAKDKK